MKSAPPAAPRATTPPLDVLLRIRHRPAPGSARRWPGPRCGSSSACRKHNDRRPRTVLVVWRALPTSTRRPTPGADMSSTVDITTCGRPPRCSRHLRGAGRVRAGADPRTQPRPGSRTRGTRGRKGGTKFALSLRLRPINLIDRCRIRRRPRSVKLFGPLRGASEKAPTRARRTRHACPSRSVTPGDLSCPRADTTRRAAGWRRAWALRRGSSRPGSFARAGRKSHGCLPRRRDLDTPAVCGPRGRGGTVPLGSDLDGSSTGECWPRHESAAHLKGVDAPLLESPTPSLKPYYTLLPLDVIDPSYRPHGHNSASTDLAGDGNEDLVLARNPDGSSWVMATAGSRGRRPSCSRSTR